MGHYSILIFSEGLSANSIFNKFSEQELAHLIFSANGRGGIDGAIQYLSQIRDQRELSAFLISAVRKQSVQAESDQRTLAEALRDTASALNQSLDLREVLDCILNKVGSVVPNDAANIMLIEDGVARMAACRGYEKLGGEARVMRQVRVLNDVPNLRRMANTRLPMVVPDTRQSVDWIDFDTSSWIRSYASVPICHKRRTIGFLNLNSSVPGFYNDTSAERLLAFADQAAIAIENARLYAKAQQEIADRTRAEEALQETTNELRAANAELAKAMRLKDTFLANMSHELRTPLNAILNISETLQEQVYGELNDAQLRSMRTIEDSGRHLLALINDILDLSKIGAGKFELNLDEISVQEVCQSSLLLVAEAARKKQITVSTSFDPAVKTIWADQRRLKQILLNLLSNAVKFTPAGGSIGLKVIGNSAEERVQFTVWDTGIGIPEKNLGNLFKPFVQLDNSLSRQYEGTGLGLALVYHIVKLHGGGIRVESEVGNGSQFHVNLHWHAEPGSTAARNGVDQDLEWGYEDPKTFITQTGHFLQEMGVAVENIWLEKGWAQKIEQAAPDFILVDIRSTTEEGFRLFNEVIVRQDIPVAMIGNPADPSVLSALSRPLPANAGYLQPPFTRQDLRTLIKKITARGAASLAHKAVILREAPPGQTGGGPTILVVDEDENEFHLLCECLTARGYRLQHAYNNAQAFERAREETPNLILMDIQTPGAEGFEAIHRIRSDQKIKHIPVVVFAALTIPGDRERCFAAGGNEYIQKPLRPQHLLKIIENQLKVQA